MDWHSKTNADITILTETWLNSNLNKALFIQSPSSHNEGIGILINPKNIGNAQPIYKELWTNYLVSIVVHFKVSPQNPILIIGFYNQPGNKEEHEGYLISFVNALKQERN